MLKNLSVFRGISEQLGKIFSFIPLDPNSLTLTSVFLAILGYLAYAPTLEAKITSFFLFIIAFFLDAIDGAVARAKKMTSKEGAFLDGISDRVVEFFLLLTILQFFSFNEWIQTVIISILFFGTCMTSFVKAYAEHKGMLKHEEAERMPGILERTERSLLLLTAFGLLIFGYAQYGIYVLYATAALSLITFVQRFSRCYTARFINSCNYILPHHVNRKTTARKTIATSELFRTTPTLSRASSSKMEGFRKDRQKDRKLYGNQTH